jgi:hypothetical protein
MGGSDDEAFYIVGAADPADPLNQQRRADRVTEAQAGQSCSFRQRAQR